MSSAHVTASNSKFISFFFGTNFSTASGWFINWPKGITYAAWQNLLSIHLWFLGTACDVQKPLRKKRQTRANKVRAQARRKRKALHEAAVSESITEMVQELEIQKPAQNGDVKLELITMLKLFCERRHISKHIEKTIPDRRNQDLITYSKQSIMMSAFIIFLLRMESGNKYDKRCHDDEEKYSKANIAKFIDAPEDRAPVIKTIEKFLTNLKESDVNDLMIVFFKDLQQSKFFNQHPQVMAGDFFLLAADCVHTHTYDHLHHTDKCGNNDCDCCLKRVYNKGTENEKVKWIHNTLVFCFVFMGRLKIPIYRYPIHSKQIVGLESASEENHKQECEFVALKTALPSIRAEFPKMKIVLLLDGLYANRPMMLLAKAYRCGYIIVRKDGCLPSLGKDCDEQAKQPNHLKNCVKRCQSDDNGWLINQKYEWFNSMYLGDDLSTNVLRFTEIRTKDGEKEQSYTCEWLFSWRLSAKNCEISARQARARWEIEDVFNTLKNRGFNLKHDYSRNPRSCFNWHGLSLFAFGVFELFRFSEAVKQRGDFAQITLAEKLEGQLLHRPTEELFSERCLAIRIQFRYNFIIKMIASNDIHQYSIQGLLETG